MLSLDAKLPLLLRPLSSPTAARTAFVLDHVAKTLYTELGGDLPTSTEVRSTIAEALSRWTYETPEEDDWDGSTPLEHLLYVRLRDCGWFEEAREGFATVVDLTVEGQAILDFLRAYQKRVAESYSADVSVIYRILRDTVGNVVLHEARQRAPEILVASASAEKMARHFRVILSSLRKREREIAMQPELKDAVAVFFDSYVSENLVRDWAAIKSSQSPFRFRPEILSMCSAALDIPAMQEALADGFVDRKIASNRSEAIELIADCLRKIEQTFISSEILIQKIDRMTIQVHKRLMSRIRYMESIRNSNIARIGEIRNALDQADEADFAEGFPSGLISPLRIYDRAALKTPPLRRISVNEGTRLRRGLSEEEKRKAILRQQFEALGFIHAELLAEFATRKLGSGDRLRLNEVEIANVEDLMGALAFYGADPDVRAAIAKSFDLEIDTSGQLVSNRWFEAPALTITRKGVVPND